MRPLALVVCRARNGVIGREGGLPWHLPEDLRHFRELTMGHAILMGRLTFASIGRALPGRRTLVVSTTLSPAPAGVEVFESFPSALGAAYETDDEPRVVGGRRIYEAALSRATVLHVTELDRDVEGDVGFPELDPREWSEVRRRRGEDPDLAFVTYVRRPASRPGPRGRGWPS